MAPLSKSFILSAFSALFCLSDAPSLLGGARASLPRTRRDLLEPGAIEVTEIHGSAAFKARLRPRSSPHRGGPPALAGIRVRAAMGGEIVPGLSPCGCPGR